jgi:hypothetical protein
VRYASVVERGGVLVGRRLVVVWLALALAVAACEPTHAPRSSAQTSTPLVSEAPTRSPAVVATPFRWPGEHEYLELSFPSAADAVTFLGNRMDTHVALPTWMPLGAHLDGGASVSVGNVGGERTAQLTLTVGQGRQLIIQYGASALDGCAPEDSVPVRVSGRPGLLRVSADPGGSPREWSELIWPATHKNPTGIYGLFGWLPRRALLAMAESMPPGSSPVLMNLNC